MENVRGIRRPWRSWTVIALVLVGLALVQACGKSGSSTGPTTTSALQLKLRRADGAQLPAGCSGGTFAVIGPGGNVLATGSFGPDGKISVPVPVGQQVTIQVTVNCPGGTLFGATQLVASAEGTTGEIVINVSRVLGLACASPVAPDQEATCTCNASAAGTPAITWTGSVNPKTGKTVKFKESTPGTYPVSCTVNGVDTQSTTVTVEALLPPAPKNGFLRVRNVDQCGECGIDDLNITIDGVTVANGLSVGDPPVTSPVTPDVPHTIRAFCVEEGGQLPPQTRTVAQDAIADVAFDSSDCGD